MEKKVVRWGVLGCSGIGKSRTIPGLLACSNAELYAIAGRNEEKLKAYAEPFAPKKLYTDYQALLDDENVDAVYLPLPNGVHMEWVVKAAKAGKHILCEKPMALTEAQVKEMFAAAKEHGVLLEEAYAFRHAQLVEKVKEIVDSGAIGKIRYLESKHSTFDTNRQGIRYQKGNGGGAVYDVTCYNVSLASFLLGSKHILFQVGAATLVCRLLEGDFLDWRRVVPTGSPIKLVANVSDLAQSVERVGLIVSEKNKSPVRCIFSNQEVQMRTSNTLGAAEDKCSFAGDGQETEIGFNVKYLLEALRAVPSEEVTLELTNGLSPIVLTPVDEKYDFAYMVLPVRIKG